MKIETIESQNRRDFVAVYVCEHCGHKEQGYGYDDNNFHQNVIPSMSCGKCGKKAGDNYRPLATKYPDFFIV